MADGSQTATVLSGDLMQRARDSRRAALNLMEDAVRARQLAEDLNRQLRDEIGERKRSEMLLQRQKEALEMVASGTPLGEVLDFLVRAVESQSPHGMRAAIHLLNPAGTHFASAAAPSLPASYVTATEGLAIESRSGPCCEALLSGEPVVVPDVAHDPRFPRFAAFAVPLGIHAGWSTPIVSPGGTVVGTFAIYYGEPREPGPQDQQVLGIVTRSVALAIEHTRAGEARARVAAIVESSDDAIVSKDLNGIITSWNTGAQRLFGYTAEEAVGQPVTLLIPPERLSEETTIIERIRRGEAVNHYETVRRRKDGSPVDVSLTVSPIRDGNGQIVGASKIARDITERNQAAEALRQADRRKDEFLAMLAHELRNPLAPIRNSLEIMRRTTHPADPAMDVLERQVGQMVRLVDDLLDTSRISRGRMELRRERLELSSVVYHAVEAAQALCDSMRHDLRVALPTEPVYLDADPTRLTQIVGNLLNNACKFMDRGGRIWLTVEREKESEVVIRVRDAGVGIAEEQIPRVFDLFTQVDNSLERARTGLGIGLTLVKILAEMHGGSVGVSSAGLGRGSEFVVRLPIVVDAPEAARPPKTPAASAPAAPLRILVVDDNHDSAESLATLLQFRGHETHLAHDGLEAVEAAARLHFDAVLLDIGLPGLNGYEAARRIRERHADKQPVLVALTGWGQDEDRRRSKEAGFDAHLVKPVDDAALLELLIALGAGT